MCLALVKVGETSVPWLHDSIMISAIALILKLDHTSESPGGLIGPQMLGPPRASNSVGLE